MKKSFMKFNAMFIMLMFASSYGFTQTDLGVDCGCPPIANRTTVVNLSSLCDGNQELTADAVLTCDKMYILDQKVYVPSGKSITIAPGTLIKCTYQSDPANATALIIERGGKIYANGFKECPIVFTSQYDPMDGTYGIENKGKWGGIILLGKASNNLTYAANNNIPTSSGGKGGLCVADGIGYIEGFDASNIKNNFGSDINGTPAVPFDDNDNSGILRYVSIRYAGANLNSTGNELNSLTLGSIGRGTTISHIEIISGWDDNVELFGGTVNIKYISNMFGWDDMLDYDLGWSGKVQFYFGITNSLSTDNTDADNGIEADADDQTSNNCPRSHPIIYNMTLIGNGKNVKTADNTALSAIMAKELAEGEIYNSLFANFYAGLNIDTTKQSTRTVTTSCNGLITGIRAPYQNWLNDLLKVENCTFVGCTHPLWFNKAAGVAPGTTDLTKFSDDGNVTAASIPGFTYVWNMNKTNNAVTDKYDAVPNPPLSSSITPSADGFFTPVNYRGAFDPDPKKNWLSDWSYAKYLGTTAGLTACPSDLNGNGTVEVTDFNVFLGAFGSTCQ
ncbi:MAG: hypothetical protein AB9842_14710 [Bacteroidales bacterium]